MKPSLSLCTGPLPAGHLSRRQLLGRVGMGLGGAALGQLLMREQATGAETMRGALDGLHFPARAKRVIYLFQSGGPSQTETWDYKPELIRRHGEDLPDSVRKGQRLTGMSGNQARLPLAAPFCGFKQHGRSGTWISDLLPRTAEVVDRLCVINSVFTEAINHDPAITFLQTGSQISGRPCIGSWVSYGLGTDNANLPNFVVLITRKPPDQPLYSRLWGSGFLPSRHQGVQFRGGRDPVLYLGNPAGVDPAARRQVLDGLREMHEAQVSATADDEINTRIAQYEMAARMQLSVPEATDTKAEPESVKALYGPDVDKPGSFAANCLLARRLAERGVKFVQLYHQGWDQHGSLKSGISGQCRETDHASAGLLRDLEQRGMLEDTLVVWGGEFGRTAYSQGKLTPDGYGRDHHPRCFTVWMAGGGAKGGTVVGETDEFSYNVARDGVHVHDLHATMLHLMGIDHERLTYFFQGRRFRLTDVHGHVAPSVLA
ncbi:MAG: DUF1501 domain-containing protein [Verrucomicrobiaceae bacterium]|nr:MAG: DUF1501 domain-containing protein [Verrucomicrobiaceae bacterium]